MTDVLIIGGGAAGSTCALFLGRAGIDVVVVDVDRSSLRQARLNNLPGHSATDGVAWLAEVRRQVQSQPTVRSVNDKVERIAATAEGFTAELASGDHHEARFVVLATGSGVFRIEGLPIEVLEPSQPFVKGRVAVDANYETDIDNVFACGILAGVPSQTVVCAGTGAHAAIEIVSRIQGEPWVDHDKPEAADAS